MDNKYVIKEKTNIQSIKMFFTKWVHLPIFWPLTLPLKSNVFKINKLAYNLFILLSLNGELI